jgi:hypothetical protein
MELDGLVMWYISVEHVRRMKSIWSAGSPLGMTSQGLVSGNKKKNVPHAVHFAKRASARTKAIYKTVRVQLSFVDRKKNWHLISNLQDKAVMQGYGSKS